MATVPDGDRRVTFVFQSGKQLCIKFPKQAGASLVSAMGNVRQALQADRFLIETDGDLLVIPLAGLAYMRVRPMPETMPDGMAIRGARLVND